MNNVYNVNSVINVNAKNIINVNANSFNNCVCEQCLQCEQSQLCQQRQQRQCEQCYVWQNWLEALCFLLHDINVDNNCMMLVACVYLAMQYRACLVLM